MNTAGIKASLFIDPEEPQPHGTAEVAIIRGLRVAH
jgi:hypothetical protein